MTEQEIHDLIDGIREGRTVAGKAQALFLGDISLSLQRIANAAEWVQQYVSR